MDSQSNLLSEIALEISGYFVIAIAELAKSIQLATAAFQQTYNATQNANIARFSIA
ncbi:hypothetical protein ACQ4M4_13100 [Leptolyngbya sp. AN02str]|uniref:hypothetical protein n=1 Tax=Leptolyngbya sp. AN02str TaxID=3423363 RepID=UPI003D3226FB